MTDVDKFVKAIKDNDIDFVKSSIASDSIDVNARVALDLRPVLVVAAELGRTEIVELLVKAGARTGIVDNRGRSALSVAVLSRRSGVLAALLTQPTDAARLSTLLRGSFEAMPFDSDGISVMLFEAGASLDARHVPAFAATSTSAIRALIARGVAVDRLRDGDQRTPLHWAASWARCNAAAIDMLTNVCGVDLEARNLEHSTCTYDAAKNSNAVALRCFVRAGANVNVVGPGGQTPLHAVGNYECAIVLLAAGAEVDQRDGDSQTACNRATAMLGPRALLASASLNRNLASRMLFIVYALLGAGAGIDDVNAYDVTAKQFLDVVGKGKIANFRRIDRARRDISKTRLDFVRSRALQVCIGLQSLRLDALQMCEILLHACGPVAPLIAFHQWWRIATTVKHFRKEN